MKLFEFTSLEKKEEQRYRWHRWFAWHPVSVNNKDIISIIWLEWIERQGFYNRFGSSFKIPYWEYTYRQRRR